MSRLAKPGPAAALLLVCGLTMMSAGCDNGQPDPRSRQEEEPPEAAVVRRIIGQLSHEDAGVRRMAADKLGQLGEAAAPAIPALADALLDTDGAVVVAAGSTLNDLAKGDIDVLADACADRSPGDRLAISAAFAAHVERVRGPALGNLGETVRSGPDALRTAAARALARLVPRTDQALLVVADLLTSPEAPVRLAAVKALAETNVVGPVKRKVIAALKSVAEDEDPDVRAAAKAALAKQQAPAVQPS